MNIRKLFQIPLLLGAFVFSFFFFESTQPNLVVNAQQCTPDVAISKEVKGDDLRVFPVGSDVSFEITIQNTGNVELTNLTVYDPFVPDCERTFASLAIGETINYSCTSTNVMQGFKNTAKVLAESTCGGVFDVDTSTVHLAGLAVSKQEKGEDSRVFSSGEDVTYTIVVTNTGEIDLTNITVSDPLVPSCVQEIASLPVGQHTTYDCTQDAVTVGFTNVVTATTTVNDLILTDNDPSTVKIPAIDIRKQAEGADSRTVASGSDVTFDIVVTNTGDVDLTNVEVSDPLAPDCDRVIGSLAVGESESYSCTVENVTAGFTNIATVTGDSGDLTVTDDDPSTVKIPAIDIRKQAEGADSRTVISGSDVTFDIVVTNTGEVDLTNVEVSDPLAPDCDRVIGSLAVGESESYSCTVENVTEGFTNVATVTGEDGDLTVTDDDPSTVKIPAIDIRKQAEGADSRTVISGSDVTFDIVVTNTGEVDLTNVEVSDPLAPDCDRVIGSLAAGESESYSCTVENVTEGFTNIASVTGDSGDLTVTDDDPSTVEIDPNSEEIYELYMPIIMEPGVLKYDVSFGYEDLRIDQANDFDYNDFVVKVNTDFSYNSFSQDTININRVAFDITPQARGALLPHEFHFSLLPNTFASNGVATLRVVDPSGNTLKYEQTAFIASQLNDYQVFNLTSQALPPANASANTFEGLPVVQAQQLAQLVIEFDTTFPFTLVDFGPHGEGLFFSPYLRVLPPNETPYNVENGDLRTIVFPIADWKWPEEKVRIDLAYPGISYIGSPEFFLFPEGWWLNYNQCVYGDGVVCP